MASSPFIIATRGSALAMAQAKLILERCRSAFPGREFQPRVVTTTGDKLQAESSAEVDLPKGLFTKELEVALLNREADLAVHSLKDLPTELPDGLELGAITTRADVRDVLIYRRADLEPSPLPSPLGGVSGEAGVRLSSLPRGFVVATSSPRRKAQLLYRRPDLSVVPIRGNVPTRLKKLATQPELGALILASAGLQRLGYRHAADRGLTGEGIPEGLGVTILSLDEMLPCVGQGALGIEVRSNDESLRGICAALNDPGSAWCALAERALLRALGGGCQTPVAAYAELRGDNIHLRAISFEGNTPRRAGATRISSEAEELGRQVAAELKRA